MRKLPFALALGFTLLSATAYADAPVLLLKKQNGLTTSVKNTDVGQLETYNITSRASDPAAVSGAGALYAKTITGAVQLFYITDTGVVAQISGTPASGWTDDGLVVRLTTNTDQVAIGQTTALANAQLSIVSQSSSNIPLQIKGTSGQTGSLFSIIDSSSNPLVTVSGIGAVTIAPPTSSTHALTVNPPDVNTYAIYSSVPSTSAGGFVAFLDSNSNGVFSIFLAGDGSPELQAGYVPSGTNAAARSMYLNTGALTGSGATGPVRFSWAIPGSSGTTLSVPIEGLDISATGVANTSANPVYNAIFGTHTFQSGGTNRLTINSSGVSLPSNGELDVLGGFLKMKNTAGTSGILTLYYDGSSNPILQAGDSVSGTNVNGLDMNLRAGASTGSGTEGIFRFAWAPSVGVSGTTSSLPVEGLDISATGTANTSANPVYNALFGTHTFQTAGTTDLVITTAAVTATPIINANGGIDRSTSGSMSIGTSANVTSMSIGRSGNTITDNGALAVSQACTVTGLTNANGGLDRSTSGTLAVGTGVNTTAITLGSSGITTTNPGTLINTGVIDANGGVDRNSSNALMLGPTNAGAVNIGGAAIATPAISTWSGTNGSGTDINGGTVNVNAGRNTGAGVPGQLAFQTGTQGTTGSGLSAVTARMVVTSTAVFIGPTSNNQPGPITYRISAPAVNTQTDRAGGTLRLAGGEGTGAATGGAVAFESALASTTGNTNNPLVPLMCVSTLAFIANSAGCSSTSPQPVAIHGTSAGASNTAGGDVNVIGGQPEGSGTGGSVILQTAQSGLSGGTLRTPFPRVTVDQNGVTKFKSLSSATFTGAEYQVYTVHVQTTNATQTVLTAPSATTFTMPTGSVCWFTSTVVARTDSTGADDGLYEIQVKARNVAGTAALSTVTNIRTADVTAGFATTSVTFTTSGAIVRTSVTGVAATTIDWSGTTEVQCILSST